MFSHRRPPSRLLVLVALVALAGCGARTRVDPPPTPPADVAKHCAALHGELPEEVAGAARSDTDPDSELTAAWGGSAIVLRCGIPKPPRMADPDQDGVEVNGVSWLLEPLDGGRFRFTTGLRVAYTEVVVDAATAKDRGAGLLVGISAAVAKTVPEGIASY
ncbi:DUF3515 domain-containing protein [Streptomyces sp. BI20]|uniref:DUF3515 domain-containing protein n=1 Tax=Streptomyces sp. BI20 TaxID=3403460 RepID=UPI003C71C681